MILSLAPPKDLRDWKKPQHTWWRLNTLYYIRDKKGQKVIFKPNAHQIKFYRNMWYRNVILKSRQLGFTTMIQLFMLDKALTIPNTACGVIAHTREDASAFFRGKIAYAYDNLPDEIQNEVPKQKSNTNELLLGNGSSIRVGTSLRSGSMQYLHISEFGISCAFYPDKAREIISGSLNTVAKGQFINIESTAMGTRGKFAQICENARRQHESENPLTELDYSYHFYPWFDDPEYSLPDASFDLTAETIDYFEQLEADEGISLSMPQKRWYQKMAETQGDKMKQEYPATHAEAFASTLRGAIFGHQMRAIRDEKRLTKVPHTPNIPVHTAWDLGRDDMNAIWFYQEVGAMTHIISYYEHRLVLLDHYIDKMEQYRRKRGYQYGTAYLPHDGESLRVDSISGTSADILRRHGLKVRVLPRPKSKKNAIDRAREKLASCMIDAKHCERGVECLDGYVWRYDEQFETFRETPLHNHASNGADAFQTLASVKSTGTLGGYFGRKRVNIPPKLAGLRRSINF